MLRFFAPPLLLAALAPLAFFLPAEAQAETFIRHNQAGYLPGAPKRIAVMADEDLEGVGYVVTKAGAEVLSGSLGPSEQGAGPHLPFGYNVHVELSELEDTGVYELSVADGPVAQFSISEDPYSGLMNQVLHHMRVARSGTDTALLHPASHLGDAACPLYRQLGDPSDGAWEADSGAPTVDMLGGWYDAGDYIKFTLTVAYTTYFLLRAEQAHPGFFQKERSPSDLSDLLDEARFGLDYLMKTHPSDDVFVIQVSAGADHSEGFRLPQDDERDGMREALSAISVPHMAYTSAALALGSRVFEDKDPARANAYREMAVRLFDRLSESDALQSGAFERDPANDFYRDQTPEDNYALAAIELYELTSDEKYLTAAKEGRSQFGGWASWGNVDVHANQLIGQRDSAAKADAAYEIGQFLGNGEGTFWNLPLIYTWASLPNWLSVAAAMATDADADEAAPGSEAMFWDLLDYTLGKNNWGVSLVASPTLSGSMQNVYSQIYTLTGEFPLGAVSEGPGDRATHDSISQYFSGPLDTSLERFNTEAAVYYDDEKDFMTQESVIIGQAHAAFMIALASRSVEAAQPPKGPEGLGGAPAQPTEPESASGCGCRAATSAPARSPWLAFSALILLSWAARSRRATSQLR